MNAKGLTGRVRNAARDLSRDHPAIEAADLADRAGVRTYAEKKRFYDAVSALVSQGDLERVGRGIYVYRGEPEAREAQKQELMWGLLRKQPATVVDLAIFSGATKDYVQEWLRSLLAIPDLARANEDGTYQLLKDVVKMPRNDRKAARLRALRAKQRESVISELATARQSIERAEKLLGEMGTDAVAE
jgi:hypothetical protein